MLAITTLLNGCSVSPATSAKISATAAYAGQKALSVATSVVLQASLSTADRETKVDFTQGLALGLRSEEGQLLASADVASLVAIWTPAKPHWAELGTQLAAVYTQAAPQTPAEAKAVLEAMAQGLEAAK